MLRSAGKIFGGAAGAAAAAPAVASQFRTQQPRNLPPAVLQDELHKRLEAGQKVFDPAEFGEPWLVPELRHALDEDVVIFGDEEIGETMQSVFGYPVNAREEAQPGRVIITEVNSDGEEEIVDQAGMHMRQAEMQMTTPSVAQEDFNNMLSTLLHNKDVQHACVKALRGDQTFQAIMDAPHTTPIHVPVQSLVPRDASANLQDGKGSNLFLAIIHDLASSIKNLGSGIAHTAVGAKNLIGKFFIETGCKLHEILGQPFSSPPVDKSTSEGGAWAGVLSNALMKVACTVFMLVILRRVNFIKFV